MAAGESERSVTLAELAGADVALQWYEAVAIAREICVAVPEWLSESRCQLPDLADVIISAAGEVVILRGEPAEEQPVSRIARIFHALLSGDVPVQLRLIVSQATAPSPAFGSVEELSRALEYFERPGRADLIRAVYSRWQGASKSASAPARCVKLPEANPPTHAMQPVQSVPRRGKKRRVVVVAVAGVVAVTAASLIILQPRARPRPLMARKFSLLVAETKKTVTNIVTAGISVVAGQTVSGTPQSASRPFASRVKAAAAARDTKSDSDVTPLRRARSAELAPAATGGERESAKVPKRWTDGAGSSAPPDTTVYTSDDVGVIPPVPAGSLVLSTSLPEVHAEDLGVLELVISETGEIESAKLQSPPKRLPDIMALHAAKAWRFEPARKDGRPVRYRKTIRITERWTPRP